MNDLRKILRGEIYEVDLGEVKGDDQGEQKGRRPCIVIQNNVGNKFSPTVIVSALTSQYKKNMCTHVHIKKSSFNSLDKDSTVLLEQIVTVNKNKLSFKIGRISKEDMKRINEAIKLSLATDDEDYDEE